MWKSKKDLKIKELENQLYQLEDELADAKHLRNHYRRLKNDYNTQNERLRREKKMLSESIASLKVELSKYKHDVSTLINYIDKMEGNKNNE